MEVLYSSFGWAWWYHLNVLSHCVSCRLKGWHTYGISTSEGQKRMFFLNLWELSKRLDANKMRKIQNNDQRHRSEPLSYISVTKRNKMSSWVEENSKFRNLSSTVPTSSACPSYAVNYVPSPKATFPIIWFWSSSSFPSELHQRKTWSELRGLFVNAT